jgi:hypothetical protein
MKAVTLDAFETPPRLRDDLVGFANSSAALAGRLAR